LNIFGQKRTNLPHQHHEGVDGLRHKILFFALSLALILGCSGVILGVSQPEGETVLAETALSSPLPEAQEAEYLVKAHGGQVCIYQGSQLLSSTGILLSSLPQQDRDALEAGIPAQDAAALAALLEDLSS
jgi:hypothetical protein